MITILGIIVGLFVGSCTAFTYNNLTNSYVNYKPVESFVFSEERVDEALEMFYKEWSKEFGEEYIIEYVLPHIKVEFTQGYIYVKGGFKKDGTPLSKDKLNPCMGYTKALNHIQVWIQEPPYLIGKTSFVHELVHVSLKLINGYYDADHLGQRWQGWSENHSRWIDNLNQKMIEKGL